MTKKMDNGAHTFVGSLSEREKRKKLADTIQNMYVVAEVYDKN